MHKAFVIIAVLAAAACDNGPDYYGPPGGYGAEIEPNDTIATATPIAANSAKTGSISDVYSDVDFYRFEVPYSMGSVRIQTFDSTGATCSGIDTFLYLLDSAGTILGWSDNDFYGCEDYTRLLGAGTYYVMLYGVYPTQFGYRLVVTTTPA